MGAAADTGRGLARRRRRRTSTQHKGRALVHAGREQPVEVHLLADAINDALGAFGKTVRLIEPVAAAPMRQQQSLPELVADMAAGKVDTLLMLGDQPGLHRARRSRLRRRR